MLEIITERADLVISKQTLAPGETGHWHKDNCSRFTVVVAGDKLGIEYRDTAEVVEVDVQPGTNGWDEPEDKVHRAINVGAVEYVEIVTFYRNDASVIPQPLS